MWPVTQQWLDALSKSHGRYTRMEVWFNGAKVADIIPESGSVSVTARNRVRRALTAVVSEAYWPASSGGLLAPSGARLKVFQGITGVDGELIGSEVPVFAGRVETVSRTRFAGKITVTALDPFADINDSQFEQPRTMVAGIGTAILITTFINEVLPAATVVNVAPIVASLPIDFMWDTDRGQAIDDLAGSMGAEVYFQPDGVTAVVRPVPVLGGPSVLSLVQGQNSTIVRDSAGRSRTDVANRIVVHVEQPGQTPFTVTVTDTESPTRYGGPYGNVVRHYRNALIATAAQAEVAGNARLARLIGITRTRDVDMVPNPALEAGDLLTVTTDEGTEQHIVDTITLPLGVADVMTVGTRSSGTSTS